MQEQWKGSIVVESRSGASGSIAAEEAARGIVVPKGTPQPVVDQISKALETALAAAEVKEKLDVAGCEARSAPKQAFADIIKADVAVWAKVVKEAGVTAD
jgi:tripartite-type tricarboxylate transporter receptor subunit TctC